MGAVRFISLIHCHYRCPRPYIIVVVRKRINIKSLIISYIHIVIQHRYRHIKPYINTDKNKDKDKKCLYERYFMLRCRSTPQQRRNR